MIHKRPFVDDECYEVAYKHPKRWEERNRYTPMANGIPYDGSYHSPQKSGVEDLQNFSKYQNEWRNESKLKITDEINSESEASTSGTIPHQLWANNGASEPDLKSEASLHLPFFPDIFLPGLPLKALFQPENIYSTLLDSPSWKTVSIGPEHQADVPEWVLRDSGFNDSDSERLMGNCVIPMSFSKASVEKCSESEGTRIECRCPDKDSVRCVGQHIMEAREGLRQNLGQEVFEKLGLCSMGEDVAETWSVEEEKAFHYVVLTNPASSGNNFWEQLSINFPSRTKKELVSYYFNVYMLRKRADQNRFDPSYIDSDDDEWQIIENEMVEDDEGLRVDSLADREARLSNT
ncbi:hypothetical protein ACFE04_011103 [Oxalis oulophora]